MEAICVDLVWPSRKQGDMSESQGQQQSQEQLQMPAHIPS